MSKGLPWLRLYAEAVDDEKLRLLAFEDRWHFVALLCCKCKRILDDEADPQMMRRKVAVKLGLQLRELDEVARRLSEVGLIDPETLSPVAWEKRQFGSDSSTERVRACRERKRVENLKESVMKHDETLQKRSSNALDTDTDTDEEKKEGTVVPLSGKPDGTGSGRVSAAEVAEVLDHLNARAGTDFKARTGAKPSKAADLIRLRLAEHGKPALIAVIDRKVAEWGRDDHMRQYLRPATLFGREKCEQYVGALPLPPASQTKPGSRPSRDELIERNRQAGDAWLRGDTIPDPCGGGTLIQGEFERVLP